VDKQQGVVLQLGGYAGGEQPFTVKNKLVMKTSKGPRTWTVSLDKQPKRQNMDMRLEKWDGVMWTGLVWLRIGTGGELL
jgi:hypothetical protein